MGRPSNKLAAVWAALVLILLFFGRGSAAGSLPLPKSFQDELESFRRKYGFPGATAAYMLPDGTTGVCAVGLADIEQDVPMTPGSRMLAASIGKSFVGATVLALAVEGRLGLDDSISIWLGDYSWFPRLPNHSGIVLRQLLNHTSGIPNHVESEKFKRDFRGLALNKDISPSPEQLISYVLDQPALFKPGKWWHYSDTGYLLVGLIIEKVTGRVFYEEVTGRFLKPLNLDLTTPSKQRKISELASGYMDRDKDFSLPSKTTAELEMMAWNPGVEWAGGGFASNSGDLVRWAGALFEGDAIEGEYLSDLLGAVPVGGDNSEAGYGIGVAVRRGGPLGPSYGHGGWIPGYCSSMRYYPEHRIAVAFQINTDIGVVDGPTSIVEEMEERLALTVMEAIND